MGAGGPLARPPPVCLGGAWRPRGWVFATTVVAFSAPSPVGRLGVRRLVGWVQRGLGSCGGHPLAGLGGGFVPRRGRGPSGRQVRLVGAWGRGVWFLSSFGGGVFLGLGLGSVGLRLVVGRSPPVVVVGSCSSRRRLPLFAVVCRCLPRPWPSDRAGCPPAAASPARFWWGWLGLFSPSVWAFRPPGVPVRARCQTAREVLGTPGAGFIATSDVACSAPSPLGLFVPLGLCPSFVLLSVSAWVGLLSPLPLSRPPVVGGAWGLRSL